MVYFDVTGEWVVDKPEQKVVWRRMSNKIAGNTFISMGSVDQPILEKDGDNLRIDWGYLYVGAPADDTNRIVAISHKVREEFIETGTIPRVDDTRIPPWDWRCARGCRGPYRSQHDYHVNQRYGSAGPTGQ